MTEKGRKEEALNKNELVYIIMIKQPDFVNEEVFRKALEILKKNKTNDLFDELYFDTIEDGLSVQMLHIGSYDNESQTFEKMKHFINDNNLKIKTYVHREIYLSDARKVEKDKLKTLLRYRVQR